ncbi:hypothetical protein GCM10007342_07400 [Staphylococcus pragensis]|nr:hypothetical protein [Staphylococcus pragensis]GGG87823.1 hypothetical protein GCM10007342_07400 [Staphylococcus pragensis]SUM60344.1 Uncharacterised protein [Staphylococcus petrasii]
MCQREGQTAGEVQGTNSKRVEIDTVKNKDILERVKEVLNK